MKAAVVAVVAGLLSLTAGCGTGQPSSSGCTPGSETTPSGAQMRTGVVGQEDDANAYTITLTDKSCSEVTTLPAGTYTVKVRDLSTIHNFRLTGPGVDEATSVTGTGDVTWTVTLRTGDYVFQCDPHVGQMSGSFMVR